jgi:hypothetical protein
MARELLTLIGVPVVVAVAVWCLVYYWLAPLCDRKGWLRWL